MPRLGSVCLTQLDDFGFGFYGFRHDRLRFCRFEEYLNSEINWANVDKTTACKQQAYNSSDASAG